MMEGDEVRRTLYEEQLEGKYEILRIGKIMAEERMVKKYK